MPERFILHPQLAADSALYCELELSDVRIMDNASLPWLILVPRVAGAQEWIDLSEQEQQRLMREIARVSQVLKSAFKPDKLNIAALGNLVPQLHVHIIARFKNDLAWPKPVWGNLPTARRSASELAEFCAVLNRYWR